MPIRTQRYSFAVTITLLLASAVPAMAEVMDKEPGIGEVWLSALLYSVFAIFLGRLHPLLGILLVFVPSTAFGMLTEMLDPTMGSAIREEAGLTYVLQTFAANVLVLSGYLLGAVLWKRRRKKSKTRVVA